MKKRVNLINRVSALGLSSFLALGLFAPAFTFEAKAEALPNVLESSATIADCVMTYYAMSGSAVANVDWINTLYSSLGSSFGTIGDFAEQGLMTFVDGVWQPVEQLSQNIANTSAYTELGLNNVFDVSAAEVASGGGFAVASGASTLSGAAACVASNGILPVLGGVTAAYWGGIGLGTLANHLINKYGKGFYYGSEMTEENITSYLSAGTLPIFCTDTANEGYQYCYFIDGSVSTAVYITDLEKVYHVFSRGNTNNVSYYRQYNGSSNVQYNARAYTLYFSNEYAYFSYPSDRMENNSPLEFSSTHNEFYQWFTRLNNGQETLKPRYSPDMIGENGNLVGNYDNDNDSYTVPDLKPQIDPGVQAGKPLTKQDWLNFANGVENNNSLTNPLPNNQSLLQDILDAIRVPVPGNVPGDNPGDSPNPDTPSETYPVPGPVPQPTPVPDPEYQPETKPQPQYTEKATENQTDIIEGDPWTTPDLLDRFPFCIPRDVYRVFTKLDSGARSAPHIQWRFHPNNKIDYTFDIDFSEWDSVATLLRTLELLGFIVALAVATRKLILS